MPVIAAKRLGQAVRSLSLSTMRRRMISALDIALPPTLQRRVPTAREAIAVDPCTIWAWLADFLKEGIIRLREHVSSTSTCPWISYPLVGPCSLASPPFSVLALLSVIVISGCSAERNESASMQNLPQEQGSSPTSNRDAVEGLRLALLRPTSATDMAAAEGILRVDGRCLYVKGPGASSSGLTPAFSFAEVSWDPRAKTLTARGVRISEGQKVRLTGSTSATPGLLDWVQKPHTSCNMSHVFVTGAIEALTR